MSAPTPVLDTRLTFVVSSSDKEIQAMEVLVTLLANLNLDQRIRVLAWAEARYTVGKDRPARD